MGQIDMIVGRRLYGSLEQQFDESVNQLQHPPGGLWREAPVDRWQGCLLK